MIITEIVTIDGKQFTYNYSNEGRYVVRDGVSYETAYDPVELGRTYTEGDLIPQQEPTEEEFAEVGKVLMGYEHNSESN